MNERLLNWCKRKGTALGAYRYAILVVVLGVVLMLLPSGKAEQADPSSSRSTETSFDLEAFEQRLGEVLSAIEGAGETKVMLTLDRSSRQVLAQDVEQEQNGGHSATIVTVGQGAGSQNVVPLQTLAPSFRGALVVCPGGRDPAVKLKLIEAVSALTGLGSDRISVCQGSV